MARTFRYLVCSFFALIVTVGAAAPAYAQPQYVQQRPVEGLHAWGQDGWCYMFNRGQWVRMDYFRSFPIRNNPYVYDLYQRGQFLKRVDGSNPGWIQEMPAANFAASSLLSWFRHPTNQNPTEANVFFLVKATNQWVSLAQLRASLARTNPVAAGANPASVLGGPPSYIPSANPASILGGGTSTPNTNPMTVLSVEADRIRREGSPLVRQQVNEVDWYLQQSRDISIKVDTLGTYVRRR